MIKPYTKSECPKDAATKLKELMAINARLPKGLIQERIVKWERI